MQTIQNTQPTSGLFYKIILLIEIFLLTWYATDPTYEVRGENDVNNWVATLFKNIQVCLESAVCIIQFSRFLDF